jgi:flagellar motor protein MotB
MFVKTSMKKRLLHAAVFAAPIFLVGCSSIPDAANPVEWYRSTVDYFSEDSADAKTETAAQPTSENTDMADASTPASAPAPKKEIASGFKAAEVPQRQYAQPIMRQGDVVSPLGEEQKVVANEPSAPDAAPTTSVSQTEMADGTPKMQLATPQQQATNTSNSTGMQDQRSVREVYEDSINQTRVADMGAQMGGSQMDEYGNFSFDTVVVSGNGVMRQAPTYRTQTQMASSSSFNGDRDNYSSGMQIEPSVVTQGQAQSLRNFNSTMFSGSFQVATIQFGNGSTSLTGEDLRILKEVLTIHKQQGGIVRIVGHASSRTRNMPPQEHDEVNNKVSMVRADKVARELLRLGMTSDRLFVGGVADQQPLYQEVMPSGEAGNRRTEIYVDY